MASETSSSSESETSPKTGKMFAIGIGMLCLMVIASIALMFVAAMNDADNREKHPVIGRP